MIFLFLFTLFLIINVTVIVLKYLLILLFSYNKFIYFYIVLLFLILFCFLFFLKLLFFFKFIFLSGVWSTTFPTFCFHFWIMVIILIERSFYWATIVTAHCTVFMICCIFSCRIVWCFFLMRFYIKTILIFYRNEVVCMIKILRIICWFCSILNILFALTFWQIRIYASFIKFKYLKQIIYIWIILLFLGFLFTILIYMRTGNILMIVCFLIQLFICFLFFFNFFIYFSFLFM